MTREILSLLNVNPAGKVEIARKFGKTRPNRYLDELMAKLVQEGGIEYTIPDKPNSRLQKYRLTAKGKHLLTTMKKS